MQSNSQSSSSHSAGAIPPAATDTLVARRSLQGAAILGVVGCSYGVLLAGPTGALSSFEWITIPLMGAFSAGTAVAVTIGNGRYVKTAGIVFSIWLATYLLGNVFNALIMYPGRSNIFVYALWFPALYAFAAAALGLRWTIDLAVLTIGLYAIGLVTYFAHHGPPIPGNATTDALIISLIAQPTFVALLFGMARFREYYAAADARAEQWRKNAHQLQESARSVRESLSQAEEANRTKARFLATMSHEIRTPLNAIIGFSEMIKDNMLERELDDTYRDYARDIHQTGQHLLHLINGILEISQLEGHKRQLSADSVRLDNLIKQTKQILGSLAERKDIDIALSLPAAPVDMFADQNAIQQILINLVGNAIKFSPPNGRVEVRLRRQGEKVEISVRDNGPGIARDKLSSLFEPFSISANPYEARGEGAGLGLYISKSLATMHGGAIVVFSEPGLGSEFIVSLPINSLAKGAAGNRTRPPDETAFAPSGDAFIAAATGRQPHQNP